MTTSAQIHVNIGEVKIGHDSDVLSASLGSCVGIALLWKRQNIFGLAHCLLPEGPPLTEGTNARFVSQAVPSLMKLMNITAFDMREINAVIAGGGNMTAPKETDPNKLIGHLNGLAAEKYLTRLGLSIVHRDLGGETGRKISIFCESAEFLIESIPRIVIEAS